MDRVLFKKIAAKGRIIDFGSELALALLVTAIFVQIESVENFIAEFQIFSEYIKYVTLFLLSFICVCILILGQTLIVRKLIKIGMVCSSCSKVIRGYQTKKVINTSICPACGCSCFNNT
jgi:hypothetical protein